MERESVRRRWFRAGLLAAAALLSLVCVTVFGNTAGSRRYYLLCVLLLVLAMAPFFLRFERRRPQAKELAAVAVLCALAVASRAAFFWAPQLKPSTAIIMIAGAGFGAETGFLVGAVTALVSNLIFGQGPWTPWQMFAFGAAGLLAGLLVGNRGRFGAFLRRPLPFACLGAVLVLFVVGPLLDTSTLVFMTAKVTWEAAAAVYLSGLPLNAVHAAGTFVTLLFLARPFLEKLARLKKKYGMMEAGR